MTTIQIKNSVLMVVDVQNGFITQETRHVLPVITKIVERWKRLDGEVTYSRYFNYRGSAFERLMDWRLLYSAPETDIADELYPYVGDSLVTDKCVYSALTSQFTELVNLRGWSDVVICGIDTDLCVLKTTFDAFEHGLTPWVLTNASASTGGLKLHEAGLAVIGRAIGEHHLLSDSEFDPVLWSG